MTSRPWVFAVFLAVSVASAGEAAAAPKDQKACADAYLEAQKTRKAGALKETKKQLEICAASKCLAAVQRECSQWLTEVDSEMPTVAVKSAGPDVTLAIDGEAHSGALDAPIALDPGKHVLVFTKSGGASVKRELTLKSGEKGVAVEPFPPPASATVEPDTTPPPPPPAKRSKTLPLILAGVGVASFAGMTIFWLKAQGKQDVLDEARCAPNCTDKAVGIITRNRILGDVALGVGIISLGAAAYFYFKGGSESSVKAAARGQLWPFVF